MRVKKILSVLLTAALVIGLLPMAAVAADEGTGLPETVQVSGAEVSAPAPELPEALSPKERMAERATEITVSGSYIFANGIPIVIRKNGSITSVYTADGTLLSGEIDVTGKWICGGLLNAAYMGSTSVTLESGSVATILGGSYDGDITGHTNVTINGGTVHMLFGGGRTGSTVNGDTNITINAGSVTGWVYGGGAVYQGEALSNVSGDTHVTLNGGTVTGNIYGGGSWRGATVTNSNVTIAGGTVYAVFGGGENASTVTGTATVVVDGNPSIGSYVYGGGAGFDNTNATVSSADVQIKSGTVDLVYGGGAGYTGASNTTGDVSISVSGGTITDLAASDNARSKVTGDVSISLTGGTIKNSCHLAGYYEPANTIQDVTLRVGSGMEFGARFNANLTEAISGDLNIDIDGTFIEIRLYDDVLPAGKEAKVTYRNIGSPNGTWTSYRGSPYLPVPGTNPQMSSPASSYGSPAFGNNKLTEFALVNSYVDFKDESLTDKPQDFATFTDKLTLDGGALRCYFEMDSNFPLTEFKNNPLLYYGYGYKGPSFGTSTMNFADTIGTARVQLLNKNGDVEADPLGGQPIATNGIGCVVAPSDAPDNTFSLQNNAFSEGKQFWGTNTVNLGGSSEVRKLWQVRNATSCCCSLGRASLRTYTFYLEELSDGFTVADYLDGADASDFTQSCPIIGHKQGQFQYTYSIDSNGTTAAGASIIGNQLTATGAGTVRVVVTAELNGRTSSDTLSVYVAERPTEKNYFFSIDEAADDYKDVVLTYKGDTLGNNGVINETNSVPPDLAWLTPEQCVWTFNESRSEATVTIKKEYLADLGETALRAYDFSIALGTGTGGYVNDKVTILVSDKEPASLALTADKTENVVYGDRVTFRAAVTKENAASKPEPTGTVQFQIDGVDCGDPVPLTAAQITLSHTDLTTGKHVVTAVYSGDDNYVTATGEMNVAVGKKLLTIKPKDVKVNAGAALPPNEVEYIGLVSGDLSSLIELDSGTLDMEYRNAADDGILADTGMAGLYKIVFKGSPVFKAADNYTIATGDGALTIEARPASSGGSVAPPKTETVTNPDGSVTKIETITSKDGTTGATVETKTETTTATDGTATKQETISISGGRDGVSGTVLTTTGATGDTSVTITLAAKDGTSTITLPAAVTSAAKGEHVTADISVGGLTLAMDTKAVEAILKVGGKTPVISAAPVADDKLPEALRGQAAGYAFTVNGKGVDFDGGTVTVTVSYTKKDASKVIGVFYVGADGKLTRVSGVKHQDDTVTFPQTHWSVYAIVEEAALPFVDVNQGDWYYDAARYGYDNQLMTGTDSTHFAPNAPMTRASLWVVLYRQAGSPAQTDADTVWYGAAQKWAQQNGISDGTNPNSTITREQLAATLYRYGGNPDVSGMALREFEDGAAVSQYAHSAMLWAVDAGLIQGSANKLMPQQSATRAEVATILMRYLESK